VKEVGIAFMPALVRRIVAGQKVVTRRLKRPSAVVGDRIWLREPWRLHAAHDGYSGVEMLDLMAQDYGQPSTPVVRYLSDSTWSRLPADPETWEEGRYRQGRFLPAALARPWRGRVVAVEWVPAPPEGIDDDEAIREGARAVTAAPLPWMPWTLDGARWAATPRAAFLAAWGALHPEPVTHCWRVQWRTEVV